MNRIVLILIVIAIILWVYFNNRQRMEMYNPKKVELIEYITSGVFDPDTFKKKIISGFIAFSLIFNTLSKEKSAAL